MGKRKEFIGTVTSDAMQKTRIVRTMRLAKHTKYRRIIKRYNKYKVHDEQNMTKIGDLVKIQETRPLSKDKRFRILEIIKKAETAQVEIKDDAAYDVSKKELK